MQKFFKDKSKLFECNISVDGAKLSETKARLILEFPNDRNLLFYGKINENGRCSIKIPALKEIDECEGKAILEIIADSTHSESWKDSFKLETNKKVMVEMIEPTNELIEETKITPIVEIITEEEDVIKENKILIGFKKYVNKNNINISDALKNKDRFLNLLTEYKRNTNSTKKETIEIFEELKTRKSNNSFFL